MGRPPKHHTTPVFYLGGFADVTDPARIWVYRRLPALRPPSRELIKEVCSERGKYSTTSVTGDVDPDSVELKLARRENEADDLFRRLRSGERPAPADKRTLAAYISMLYLRGRNQEERRRVSIRRAAHGNLNTDRLAMAAAWDGEFGTAYDLLQQPEKHRARFEQNMMSESLPIPLENDNPFLFAMKWRFLTPPEGEFFVTTDSPVHLAGDFGLRHSQADVLFPISSELLLHAAWYLEGEDLAFEPGRHMAHVVNVFLMRQAHREVYARENAPWVMDQLRVLADEAARVPSDGSD
jgi:hypothetical protein